MGKTFNINNIGHTRGYQLDNFLYLGMKVLQKCLFGTDEETDREQVKREMKLLFEMTKKWELKLARNYPHDTRKSLTVDLKDLLNGLQDKTPRPRDWQCL